MADNSNINTDDYDLYTSQGVPEALPGTPEIDDSGHLIILSDGWISPGNIENSTMDKDPNNTGPMTDFWSNFPLTIDINGNIFYYEKNTGINVRGPEGAPRYVSYDELTEEERALLKGQDGTNGVNGRDGIDGTNGVDGLDAYHVWLRDNGYSEEDHPVTEFYAYIASFVSNIVKEGDGQGSIIVNYNGLVNEANGEASFASGYQTIADGDYSFSAGIGTRANEDYQFVIGSYNTSIQNALFEIGSGTDQQRQTCFYVTNQGRVVSTGNIEDGFGNILSDKVDKIEGKSLSSNDFTSSYKSFLDNYEIENSVLQNSENPVKSSAIYLAIEQAKQSVTSKPTIEQGSSNSDYPILSYRPVDEDEYLEAAVKFNQLSWNPSLSVFKGGSSVTNTGHSYNFMFGRGLEAASDDQLIFGKYNTPNSADLVQIGYGTSAAEDNNIFTLSKTGNLTVDGDITDGLGNVLKNKQNTLSYDAVPTFQSMNVMTSGAIYNAFTSVGITPYEGIDLPQLTSLQNQINSIQTYITTLNTRLTNLINTLYQITDDTTSDVYKLGISNGEFYIENQTEEEEEVTNGDNN